MEKYLFIGGEFNGQRREASGDIELVFCEQMGNTWYMVCYVRQTWVQGPSCLFNVPPGQRTQEIYVLDSLSDNEAIQLMHKL